MTGSSRRIVVVAVFATLATAVVLAGLLRLMVEEHDLWLERSYRNRWSFRDVPTRRGSIYDRTGQRLVHDVPRYALELNYRAFRRLDPIGAASATDLAARSGW